MKALSSAVLILLTLGLSAQAAGARSQAVTLDPHRSICANGYVRMLEVSGVEEAYSAGLYPWLRATIDQTGFKPGEYPRVTAYYNGGGAADQKWSALLNTLQQAYLSRSPVIIYHAFLGGVCQDDAAHLTVQLCESQAACNGVTSLDAGDDPADQ